MFFEILTFSLRDPSEANYLEKNDLNLKTEIGLPITSLKAKLYFVDFGYSVVNFQHVF